MGNRRKKGFHSLLIKRNNQETKLLLANLGFCMCHVLVEDRTTFCFFTMGHMLVEISRLQIESWPDYRSIFSRISCFTQTEISPTLCGFFGVRLRSFQNWVGLFSETSVGRARDSGSHVCLECGLERSKKYRKEWGVSPAGKSEVFLRAWSCFWGFEVRLVLQVRGCPLACPWLGWAQVN